MHCGIERLAHCFDPLDALRIQQVCQSSLDPLKVLDDTGRRICEVRARAIEAAQQGEQKITLVTVGVC